jgi:energy-coupling factor transporter transmembrane protein EcfT
VDSGNHYPLLSSNSLYSSLVYSPSVLFCSVLFCSVLFCSVLFCSVLYCSVLFFSVLFCSALFCSVLFISALVYCTLLSIPAKDINVGRNVLQFSHSSNYIQDYFDFCTINLRHKHILLFILISSILTLHQQISSLREWGTEILPCL